MEKINLFDDADEWNDMPEFVQERQKEFKKLIVRFDSENDLQAFAKLIGQPLTNRTKSIWFPQLVRGKDSTKRYVSTISDLHSVQRPVENKTDE